MEWLVEMQGDKSDLQDLGKSLSSPELCITKDGDNFVLKSTRFERFTNVDDVRSMACELLSLINGAAKLALDMRERLTIRAIVRVKDDDTRSTFICLSNDITVRGSIGVSIVSPTGVVEEIHQADPIPDWVRIGQQDEKVFKVLQLLGSMSDDWVNLYRMLEIVQEDVGGIKKIQDEGWATKRAVRLFKHTSQSPDAIGDKARHGVQEGEPPTVPMPLSEARSLIKTIIHNWLRLKREQTDSR